VKSALWPKSSPTQKAISPAYAFAKQRRNL
jgi:hypothetical protein